MEIQTLLFLLSAIIIFIAFSKVLRFAIMQRQYDFDTAHTD